MTCNTSAEMLAGLMHMTQVTYVYESLSGFLTVCPYLVLITLLFCWAVPFSSGVFIVSCLWSLLITSLPCWLLSSLSLALPSWVFFVCWWNCVLWLLLVVWALAYAIGLLLIHFNMYSNGSVHVFECFVVWYCRYASAVTDVGLMCCLMHVILLQFVVSCMMYAWLWWLWSPVSTAVPWVQSLLSSHWTATADPLGIDVKIGEASLLFLCCLSINLPWCLSSWSSPIGFWSKTGMVLHTCHLNINVAGLSKPWPNGVVQIFNRTLFICPPESVHFLMFALWI